jgi:hypothetical protein
MKRLINIVSVLVVCAMSTNAFATWDHNFGWTISMSSTDPNVCYSPTPLGGTGTSPDTLYLWLECLSGVTGAAASEWQLVTTGMSWVGIVGVSPYLFTGRRTDLLGSYGNINTKHQLVGIITVFDPSGGSICFAPSFMNDRNITIGVDGKGYPNEWRGFHSAGFGPDCCETDVFLCWIVRFPVETETWGRVKSIYR